MTRRLVRPGSRVWGPDGRIPVGRTKFLEDYAGRLTIVHLGPRAIAYLEDELDALVDELIDDARAAVKDQKKSAPHTGATA